MGLGISRLQNTFGTGSSRLNLLSDDTSRQTFNSILERAVLGGVDQRVDETVG